MRTRTHRTKVVFSGLALTGALAACGSQLDAEEELGSSTEELALQGESEDDSPVSLNQLPSVLAKQNNNDVGGGNLPVAAAAPSIRIDSSVSPYAPDIAYTKKAAVRLTLEIPMGDAEMCISNTPTCTAWVTAATPYAWNMTSTNGTKTVYAKFRTGPGGAESAQVSDTTVFDSQGPGVGTASAQAAVISGTPATYNDFLITLHNFTDTGSGILQYRLIWSTTGAALNTTCTSLFAQDISASLNSYSLVNPIGVTEGDVVDFRLCAIDNAGNISSTLFSQNAGTDDLAPDAGAAGNLLRSGMQIVTGVSNNEASGDTAVDISVSGPAGTAKMCISGTTSCTNWITYATTRPFTLSTGSGLKTVYVWLRDAAGNSNTAPFIDTVVLDTTVPTNGKVSKFRVTGMTPSVTLTWSGFKDPETDIKGYKVVRATGSTAPANCSGTDLNSGVEQLSFQDTTVTDGTIYSYRICAVNNVDAVSAGTTITVPAAAG